MTTASTGSQARPTPAGDDSIRSSLHVLDGLLADSADLMFDPTYYRESLGPELRRLHARFRIHHAADCIAGPGVGAKPMPPEHAEEFNRLHAEHTTILGQLDRVIRSVDSMADRSLEDKDVFFMRMHEVIAVLRRHEAEEDRLFYLSLWRDIGGES